MVAFFRLACFRSTLSSESKKRSFPAGTSTLNFSWPSTLKRCWILVGFESWMDVEKWRWINVTYQRWTNVDATFIQHWINVDATLIQCWCKVQSTLNFQYLLQQYYYGSLVFSHSNIFHGREFITTLLAKRYEKGDMVFWQHYKKVG